MVFSARASLPHDIIRSIEANEVQHTPVYKERWKSTAAAAEPPARIEDAFRPIKAFANWARHEEVNAF